MDIFVLANGGDMNGGTEGLAVAMDSFSDCLNAQHSTVAKKRRKGSHENGCKDGATYTDAAQSRIEHQISQWKRIMLLVIAITVHNIPEGTIHLHIFPSLL